MASAAKYQRVSSFSYDSNALMRVGAKAGPIFVTPMNSPWLSVAVICLPISVMVSSLSTTFTCSSAQGLLLMAVTESLLWLAMSWMT